ncbi:MAG: hypothetical protein ABI699_16215 [Caldimonas sp.]
MKSSLVGVLRAPRSRLDSTGQQNAFSGPRLPGSTTRAAISCQRAESARLVRLTQKGGRKGDPGELEQVEPGIPAFPQRTGLAARLGLLGFEGIKAASAA